MLLGLVPEILILAASTIVGWNAMELTINSTVASSIAEALKTIDVEDEVTPYNFVSTLQWLLYVFKVGLELEGDEVKDIVVFYSKDLWSAIAIIVSLDRVFILYAKRHLRVNDVDRVIDLAGEVGEAYPDHEVVPVLASYTCDVDAEKYAYSLDIPILTLV